VFLSDFSCVNSSTFTDHVNEAAISAAPIIIDLGKISRKKIKQLKKAKGVYLDQVQPAIAQVKANLGVDAAGKEIVPVVVLYQKKARKRKLPMLNLLR
jgi:hypothetical protein